MSKNTNGERPKDKHMNRGVDFATYEVAKGVYPARCTSVIDLGLQYCPEVSRHARQTMLVFEMHQISDENIQHRKSPATEPIYIHVVFNTGLKNGSAIKEMLNEWIGSDINIYYAHTIELGSLAGMPCRVKVDKAINVKEACLRYGDEIHVLAGEQYMNLPPGKNIFTFDMEEKETWENFYQLDEWIRAKLREGAKELYRQHSELQGEIPSINAKLTRIRRSFTKTQAGIVLTLPMLIAFVLMFRMTTYIINPTITVMIVLLGVIAIGNERIRNSRYCP